MSEHILTFRFRFAENIITQITPNLIYKYIYNCGAFESWIQINIAPILFLFKVFGFVHICLTQFFFQPFWSIIVGSWTFLEKGEFLFFYFFQKELFEFQERLTNFCAICVYIYIYCCTYSCSMRQFSWATLPVNKISFFIFGFPYSVVLVLIIVVQMGVVNITKNTTMICAPLMAQSVEQVLSNMYQAKAEGADVVEIRLDCISNFQPGKDLEIILTKKPLPVLIVYR